MITDQIETDSESETLSWPSVTGIKLIHINLSKQFQQKPDLKKSDRNKKKFPILKKGWHKYDGHPY